MDAGFRVRGVMDAAADGLGGLGFKWHDMGFKFRAWKLDSVRRTW